MSDTAKEILKEKLGGDLFETFSKEMIFPHPSGKFPMVDLIYEAMEEYKLLNNKNYTYCQREIEGESLCSIQCDHCQNYYKQLFNNKYTQTQSEYQLCPKCTGNGYMPNPFSTSNITIICDVCSGAKILIKPLLNNNSGGWIRVTDRMPELNKFTLLDIGVTNVPVLACYKGDNKFLDISLNAIWDVKEDEIYFWMPLPEPPK